jgi:hypothetical protein
MDALTIQHFLSPTLLLPAFLTLALAPVRTQPELPGIRPIVVQRVIPRSQGILLLLLTISTSYALDGAIQVARSAITGQWHGLAGTGWAVYAVGNVLVWGGSGVAVSARQRYGGTVLMLLVLIAWVEECVALGLVAKSVKDGEFFFPLLEVVCLLLA